MSQRTDQLKNHPIWQELHNLGPAIDKAFEREGIDPQTKDDLARLKAVLTFTGRRLAGADPYLFQPGPLDSICNYLQQATAEVSDFVANGEQVHIIDANAHIDKILGELAQLNVQLTTEDFLAAKEAAESYRLSLIKALSEITNMAAGIRGDLDSLKTRLGELSEETTTERANVQTIVTEFQGQFSTAQENRNREFAEAQGDRQERFTSLHADYEQKLSEQTTEFSQQREEITKAHMSQLAELKKTFIDASTKFRDEIIQRKEEVEKLVGVIGNLGVTSGYQKTANEAKTTVRIWQVVAVVAMLGMIGIAGYAFLPVIQGGFAWSGFAGRVFVSLTVGVLAGYAASQADKYQKIEMQNRRLALELEAIGPFIAPLPEGKQEEFRLKIGDRSFGHTDSSYAGFDAKSPATVVDILMRSKEFQKFVIDLVKASNK